MAVSRRPLDLAHPKLRQVVHADFLDFSAIAGELDGADACFWGLGCLPSG